MVTAGLANALQASGSSVGLLKPLQSGHLWHDLEGDGARLKAWTGIDDPLEEIVSYSFAQPVCPLLAAEMEQTSIDFSKIDQAYQTVKNRTDWVLVEGAGGLLTPITQGQTICDLIQYLQLPLVIVARNGLGTINHTLLTIHIARQNKIPIAGVILNDATNMEATTDLSRTDNRQLIEQFGNIKVWGSIPFLHMITREKLQEIFTPFLDQLGGNHHNN